MSDLIDYLNARWKDEEQMANACDRWAPPPWVGAFKEVTSEPGGTIGDVASTVAREVSHHVAYWQPDHVRAELEAKRLILDELDSWLHMVAADAEQQNTVEERATAAEGLLRLLAQPYADRPGFREEWKP
jgi:hypothetical protein